MSYYYYLNSNFSNSFLNQSTSKSFETSNRIRILDVINLHINLFKLTLQDKNTVAIVSK